VAVELTGGLDLAGPDHIIEAVMLALRCNRAVQYSPDEPAPGLSLGSRSARWSLRVDSCGRGVLVDRVNADAHPLSFEVDLLEPQAELAVRALESVTVGCRLSDLVLSRECPHALVSGMTGSGKTEFLVSWLFHMAESASPDELAIAIVDFKGAGAFARLKLLPHLRHLVSDLEPRALVATVEGIQAQLLMRERRLAQWGVSDVVQLPVAERPPRCVLVIDEYRAVVEAYPAFRSLVADIAMRGRALGINLIVCTQSFSALSVDALLSNVQLRVLFRASDPGEARLLLGASHASSGQLLPGHALVAGKSQEVMRLEFTLASPMPRQCEPALVTVQRPLWLEPRASSELPRASTGHDVVLGAQEDHEALIRHSVRWNPAREGVLLCLSASHVQRHRVQDLVTLARPEIEAIPAEPALAWDALAAGQAIRRGFAISNLDALISRMPAQWRDEFVELVIDSAHRASSAGAPVVLGLSAEGSALSRLRQMPSHVLRVEDQGDRALLGSQAFTLADSSGSPLSLPDSSKAVPVLAMRAPSLIVSTRVSRWKSFETRQGVLILAPHELLARASAATISQEFDQVVIDGCSPAEMRALRLSEHPLPPPLTGTVFELDANGGFRRMRVEPW
jgi:S-DNA-T family DNA segregation ATPase FtsK/SpoIIIE